MEFFDGMAQKTKNISEMLTSLIEEYRFNKNTLSKYLEITEETVD